MFAFAMNTKELHCIEVALESLKFLTNLDLDLPNTI